ncbi:hypothetical protein D3C87_1929940 [compost metagenome]
MTVLLKVGGRVVDITQRCPAHSGSGNIARSPMNASSRDRNQRSAGSVSTWLSQTIDRSRVGAWNGMGSLNSTPDAAIASAV